MKKRKIAALMAAVLLIGAVLSGCGKLKSAESVEYTTYNDTILGLTLDLPAKEYADWIVLYGPISQDGSNGKYEPVDGSSFIFMPDNMDLFYILCYRESDWTQWLSEGSTAESITGCKNIRELGQTGNIIYLLCEPALDQNAVAAENVDEFNRIIAMLPHIKESITFTAHAGFSVNEFPKFSATDISGGAVSNTSFSEYQMTMVNFWGTFCEPCIAEMPELQKLSQQLPKGVQLVGIITDALDDEHITLAKDILDEKGVTFSNWIPDKDLQEYINSNVTGVPMTLFIDSDGQIVGDIMMGKADAEEYLRELSLRIDMEQEDASETVLNPKPNSDEHTDSNQPSAAGAYGNDSVMERLRGMIDLSGTVIFSAVTPFGDEIDSSVFSNYDLTMINIWGTLCQPCIKEMPDIQRLYADVQARGVNIIGFIANSESDRIEKSKEILSALGVTYQNVVFSDDVSGAIVSQISGFPTTIFVDREGNVVGDQLAGAHSYDEYLEAIDTRLEGLTK